MRLPMLRTEISHNFDAGESSEIYHIYYNPESTSIFKPMPALDGTGTTPKPLKIYSYDFQVAASTLTQMWQSYYDEDDTTTATNWNPSSSEFCQALKQEKLVAGTYQRYVTDWDAALLSDHYVADAFGEDINWRVATIKFRAGRWSKRKKKYVGGPPPIELSPYKKNKISWHVANVGNSDNRSYYASLRIKKWRQVV